MDKANPSVVVAGYIKVAPKDREAFVKVLQAHVPRVRKKDGCIAYAFAVDVADPNVVRMSEARRDRQSLERHLATTSFKECGKNLCTSSSSSGAFNDMAFRQ